MSPRGGMALLRLARRLLHAWRFRARRRADGSDDVCALCATELLPTQARYRLDEGPAHKECYQRVTRFPPEAG